MLTQEQVRFFEEKGHLVLADVLDQKTVLGPVRADYSELPDRLYEGRHHEGKVPAPEGMSFDDKLLESYRAKCDWFQPLNDRAEWLKIWQDARARLAVNKHVSLYRWDDSALYCA